MYLRRSKSNVLEIEQEKLSLGVSNWTLEICGMKAETVNKIEHSISVTLFAVSLLVTNSIYIFHAVKWELVQWAAWVTLLTEFFRVCFMLLILERNRGKLRWVSVRCPNDMEEKWWIPHLVFRAESLVFESGTNSEPQC